MCLLQRLNAMIGLHFLLISDTINYAQNYYRRTGVSTPATQINAFTIQMFLWLP